MHIFGVRVEGKKIVLLRGVSMTVNEQIFLLCAIPLSRVKEVL